MDISKVIQEIQYILAPAFMISSAALLLLGLQNKFSTLANRFRVLNHEKQQLWHQDNRSQPQEARLSNLKDQVEHLFRRASLVKNAILFTYGSIIFFTGTSILILLSIYSSHPLHVFIIIAFAAGLFLLFVTAVSMLLEVGIFFHILTLEKKSWVLRSE